MSKSIKHPSPDVLIPKAVAVIRRMLRKTEDVFQCSGPVLCAMVPGLRMSQVPKVLAAAADIPVVRNGVFTIHYVHEVIMFIRLVEPNRHNTYVAEPVWNTLRSIYGHPKVGVIGTVTIAYLYAEGDKKVPYHDTFENSTVAEALSELVDNEVSGIVEIISIEVEPA